MNQEHAVVVTGMGRCGSSLVMAMLQAGGMELVADETATFESRLGTVDSPAWPNCARGRAIKVLDVHLAPLRLTLDTCRYILVTRSHAEQAKSMRRFMRDVLRQPTTKDAEVGILRGLQRDQARLKEWLRLTASPHATITFELLLALPENAAQLLKRYAGRPDLDVAAMAAVVRKRSPRATWGPLAQWALDG